MNLNAVANEAAVLKWMLWVRAHAENAQVPLSSEEAELHDVFARSVWNAAHSADSSQR